jgi:hypothetical protein
MATRLPLLRMSAARRRSSSCGMMNGVATPMLE